MTETKEPYQAVLGNIVQLTPPLLASIGPAAPSSKAMRMALEAIRDLCDQELARIERDGGCAGFAMRVREMVGRVLR